MLAHVFPTDARVQTTQSVHSPECMRSIPLSWPTVRAQGGSYSEPPCGMGPLASKLPDPDAAKYQRKSCIRSQSQLFLKQRGAQQQGDAWYQIVQLRHERRACGTDEFEVNDGRHRRGTDTDPDYDRHRLPVRVEAPRLVDCQRHRQADQRSERDD